MITTKHRTAIATLIVALAVGLAPGVSHAAIKTKPTGDAALDSYCAKVAGLVDHAVSQGDIATLDGRDEDAAAWYGLAAEMIRRSTANGCTFYAGRVFDGSRPGIPVGPVQTSTEPTKPGAASTVGVGGPRTVAP